MWAIPTGTSSFFFFFFFKSGKESQYLVSRPGLGSDPPIGSDWESGGDKLVSEPRFRCLWKSLRLRIYLHSKVLA